MVEVVVPQHVEPVAALILRPRELCLLSLIFSHQQDGSLSSRLTARTRNGGQDMTLRIVENALGGVQPESVEVIFRDPVSGIGDKKFPYRRTVLTIEVDCCAPVRF